MLILSQVVDNSDFGDLDIIASWECVVGNWLRGLTRRVCLDAQNVWKVEARALSKLM